MRTGRTSIAVDVEVYAQRNPTDVICVKVTEASLTYVAVGSDSFGGDMLLERGPESGEVQMAVHPAELLGRVYAAIRGSVWRRRQRVASDEHRDWSLECCDVMFQVSINEEEVRG